MNNSSPGGQIYESKKAKDKAAASKATKESATNLAKEVTAAKKKATLDLKKACSNARPKKAWKLDSVDITISGKAFLWYDVLIYHLFYLLRLLF